MCPKPHPDGTSELVLTPLELIDKIAALVPPPRAHRHCYYGVLDSSAQPGSEFEFDQRAAW